MTRAILPTQQFSGTFYGVWERKYLKNIPGPIYSTSDNMLSLLACNDDRAHILYDDQCEFVWKQPATPDEFRACFAAIDCDEAGSYQIDGNKHWTPDLVRQWWRQKDNLLEWARLCLDRPIVDPKQFWNGDKLATDRETFREYTRYMLEDAEQYLRSYIFLLENAREAVLADKLPML